MHNRLLQLGLRRLRTHGYTVAMLRDEGLVVADGYDRTGRLVYSARAVSRKRALGALLSTVHHQAPGLLDRDGLD